MSNFLTTIKEQIKALVGPQEYQRMKASQELGIALDEYRERIVSLSGEATRAARKLAKEKGMNEIEMAQEMNLAARMSEEIEMVEIQAELQNLYRQTTE